ncbi:MCE family protein [Aeromicrobium sp. CTD01-1L150]|uniref:MCE family protein n=1 Tax=Aeromicrobium sp. CTD01-1L150 TaxID=3341830 RepID=UPI0035BF12EA
MGWAQKITYSMVAVGTALLMTALVLAPGSGTRTITAHFDRAVAVYPGTDLRVMGVRIGEVTAVVPDGNSVRVELRYDQEYELPAEAEAAVVTSSLVADRYVQVSPAYGGGPAMADGDDIPLERTKTPIELDRTFTALNDLSTTLGPEEGASEGALGHLLTAGAKALEGNGERGSEAIRNMSAAADTFARNRGPLFENVRSLAEFTDTLAENDATVESFIKDLSSVSGQLAGERDELKQLLESLAQVLGSVEGFVQENRDSLGKNVDLLDSLLERVDNQKDSVGLVVQKGALAMGNLAVAYEPTTGTFGSRVQVAQGILNRPDQFLCQTLVNAGAPQSVCDIITSLLRPLIPATSGDGDPSDIAEQEGSVGTEPASGSVTPQQDGPPSLSTMLGGDL